MGDLGKAVRFVRNNLIALGVLFVWTVLAWLCQSWWRGLGALLTIAAGLFVLRFVQWRKARLEMLTKAETDAPKLPPLVRDFVVAVLGAWWWPRQWRETCKAMPGLTSPTLKVAPKLRDLEASVNNDLAASSYPGGVKCVDAAFVQAAPKMAGMMHGLRFDFFGLFGLTILPKPKDVRVRVTEPGFIRVEVVFSEPLKSKMLLADSPKSPDKRMYVLGAGMDGKPILAPKNRAGMFGALSGCGKSNQIHYIVGQMLADGDPLWLYVSDPGGTEMAEYADHVGEQQGLLKVCAYAVTLAETRDMLAKAVKDMNIRQAWMAKQTPRIRQMTEATEANPRALIILDEQALIQAVYKGGTDNDLGTLYTNGRKANFVVLGGTQDARADTIPGPLRSTIPTRWCGPTADPDSTECILGKGAVAKGARSHELDRVRDVGLFYSGSEDTRFMTLGLAPRVLDSEVRMIARGQVPPAMLERRVVGGNTKPYVLYRTSDDSVRWSRLYGKRPVYVGITNDWPRRRGEHERLDWKWCGMHRRMENYWLEHVASWTVTPLNTTDIKVAQAAERKAIHAERPVFNDHHNRGQLVSRTVQGWFRRPVAPSEPVEGVVLAPVAVKPVRGRGRLVVPVNGHTREDWSE